MIPQKDPSKPVTVMFGGNFVAFKTTPLKQAAAWEWIKFFSDRDQTVNWSIKSSYMPVRRSAADHPDLKAHWDGEPQARQAFQLTPTARPEPTILAWQEIRELVQAALTSVISGRAAPKAALDSAAAEANKLIAERR
jgi:sn-glycerol 3-phosphate transport system substrate-binding protein